MTQLNDVCKMPIQFLHNGLTRTLLYRLHVLDPALALGEIEDGVNRVFPFLSDSQDGTRLAAQMVLKNVIQTCVKDASLAELKQMKSVFRTLEKGLDMAHQGSLLSVLPGTLASWLRSSQTQDCCLKFPLH